MADIYRKYDSKTNEWADFGDLKARQDLGFVEDTDVATHTIAAGQYVIWKGNLYTANSAITPDTALSSSNLTAVGDKGGLNKLNEKIDSNVVKTIHQYNVVYNNQIKSNSWIIKCIYGNVVVVSGNIIMSDSFPIKWGETIISTDFPQTSIDQYCGIVRFDEANIPSAIVIARSVGLGIDPRNIDIRGKQGILEAIYIAKN